MINIFNDYVKQPKFKMESQRLDVTTFLHLFDLLKESSKSEALTGLIKKLSPDKILENYTLLDKLKDIIFDNYNDINNKFKVLIRRSTDITFLLNCIYEKNYVGRINLAICFNMKSRKCYIKEDKIFLINPMYDNGYNEIIDFDFDKHIIENASFKSENFMIVLYDLYLNIYNENPYQWYKVWGSDRNLHVLER